MSHTHFCDIAGHPWQCESSECICICQKQIEQSDHSRCPIELRACSQHDKEQVSNAHRDQCAPSVTHETDAGAPHATRTEQEDCGRIQPIPPEIEEKFEEWAVSDRNSLGFCFVCGNPILTEADFIPGTYIHNCAEGQLFEREDS